MDAKDDEFDIPSAALDFHMFPHCPGVLVEDFSSSAYLSVLRVLFGQIAPHFSTRYSPERTLKAKGRTASRRAVGFAASRDCPLQSAVPQRPKLR